LPFGLQERYDLKISENERKANKIRNAQRKKTRQRERWQEKYKK
jgi:hypothetical protein